MRPLACVLLLVVSACSSTGDGGTQPGPSPAISIALSPSSASIAQGGSAQVIVTITRSGGFTGTVTVSVSGAPAGVTGAVGGSQTSNGVTTASVTVDVAATTAPGTYTLTVQGSGSGVASTSATFTLTVTALAGYTLTPTPATLSIAQGGNGTVAVAINRSGGFGGNVTLAAQGLPTGVTAAFAPNPAGGNASTLTLTAAAGAAVGTATITIRGTAAGLADQTVTVSLTVTASASAGVTLDFGNCVLLGFPVWLAYQDGSGPWTRVNGTNNVYQFNLTQSKAAVAWTTGGGVSVWFMTRAELTNGTVQVCEPVGPKQINGTVAGVAAGHHARVNLGNSSAPSPIVNAWTIDRVRNGPQDLVAYRATQSTPRVGEKGVIIRDLDIATNGSAGVVDFGGAQSFDPLTATVTVSGLAGDDQLVSQMNYLTTTGCAFGVLHGAQGLANPFTTAGVPPANQRATDFHLLSVTGNSPTLGTRGVQYSFNALGNLTATLPPSLPSPAVTVLGGPYRRLQAVTTTSTEYDSHTQFTYWQGVGALPMSMLATAGWLGGTAVTLAFPDLSGVAGWNAAWAPPSGAGGSWNMISTGKSMGFAGNQCVEGGVVKSALRNGMH